MKENKDLDPILIIDGLNKEWTKKEVTKLSRVMTFFKDKKGAIVYKNFRVV